MESKVREEKLLVDVARLNADGEWIDGEVDIVDYESEYVHPFGGIRFHLFVQHFGSEVLVRGNLEQDFTLTCSRCGEDFDTTIKVDDYTASFEVSQKAEFVDLTNDARECIILALPSFPLCEEACPGIEQKNEIPGDDRWNALDGLMVEK